MPNSVVGVNHKVKKRSSRGIREIDIETRNAVIQVKGGSGSGMLSQALATKLDMDKEVICYLPDKHPKSLIVRDLQQSSLAVFTDESELLNYLYQLEKEM